MLKLFSVRDIKGYSFAAPMAIPSVGIAKRSFLEACAAPSGPLYKYPEDYQLYQVGEFDPNCGELKALPKPLFVMSAVEAKEARECERLKSEPMIPGVTV